VLLLGGERYSTLTNTTFEYQLVELSGDLFFITVGLKASIQVVSRSGIAENTCELLKSAIAFVSASIPPKRLDLAWLLTAWIRLSLSAPPQRSQNIRYWCIGCWSI